MHPTTIPGFNNILCLYLPPNFWDDDDDNDDDDDDDDIQVEHIFSNVLVQPPPHQTNKIWQGELDVRGNFLPLEAGNMLAQANSEDLQTLR